MKIPLLPAVGLRFSICTVVGWISQVIRPVSSSDLLWFLGPDPKTLSAPLPPPMRRFKASGIFIHPELSHLGGSSRGRTLPWISGMLMVTWFGCSRMKTCGSWWDRPKLSPPRSASSPGSCTSPRRTTTSSTTQSPEPLMSLGQWRDTWKNIH